MANFEELLYMVENGPDLMLEMKSKNEYARRRFKKKYKFTPSKDDPNRGTVTIDGEKYTVDIGKGKSVEFDSPIHGKQILPRSVITVMDDDFIILNDDFFKLKNQKRRDAILNHEVAHTKLHALNNPDKKNYRKDLMTKNTIDMVIKAGGKDLMISMGITATDKMLDEYLHDVLQSEDCKKVYDKYLNMAKNTDENKRKLRDEAQRIMKKYISSKVAHNNVQELEADRYAAHRTSKSAMKKGLAEYTKRLIKNDDKKKFPEFSSDARKCLRSDAQRRNKALDDKTLNRNGKMREIY